MEEKFQKIVSLYEEIETQIEHDIKWFQGSIACLKEKLDICPLSRHVRIASWNINGFKKKCVDQSVIDAVAQVINKNKFDIIAVQEVGVHQITQVAKENCIVRLFDQLKWLTDMDWDYVVSCDNLNREYGAFVWKRGKPHAKTHVELLESSVIDLKFSIKTLKDDTDYKLIRKPFVATFMIEDWKFSLVSSHLICATGKSKGESKRDINSQECRILPAIISIAKSLQAHSFQHHDVILLGDFNCIPDEDVISTVGYKKLLEAGEYTNTLESKCFDNILVHSLLKNFRYCQHGIGKVEENEKMVSDHLPVYAEFY